MSKTEQRRLDQVEAVELGPFYGRMRITFVVNRGNYNSFHVEVDEPYDLTKWTMESKFNDLMDRLLAQLVERKLIRE